MDADNKHNISDDENNTDDMNLDKNNAFEDPSGIQLSEKEKYLDEVMEEAQDSEAIQETDSGPGESDEEIKADGEHSDPIDHIDDENLIQVDDNIETREGAQDTNNTNVDMESIKENIFPEKTDPSDILPLLLIPRNKQAILIMQISAWNQRCIGQTIMI